MDTILGHSHQKERSNGCKNSTIQYFEYVFNGIRLFSGYNYSLPSYAYRSSHREIVLLLCLIASSYEIGLILNRAGSVIIEPVLIKTKFLRFSENYSLYAEASKKTPMLNTISREYALSRTSIVEFLVLAIWSTCIGKWLLSVCYLAVAIVFLFSCKKHSAKIATVVEIFRKTHKSTQQ